MKKLFNCVDYQNDFVDGSLEFPKAKLLEHRIAMSIVTSVSRGTYLGIEVYRHCAV